MRISFIAFFSLLSLFIHSQTHFRVTVKCPKIFNRKAVYLTIFDNYSNNRFTQSDSILIQGDTFSFSGLMPKYSENAFIKIPSIKYTKFFIIDSGNNYLKIEQIGKNNFLINENETMSYVVGKKIDSIALLHTSLNAKHNDLQSDKYYAAKRSERLSELRLVTAYPSTFYSLIHLYKLSYLMMSLKNTELIAAFYTLDSSLQRTELGTELLAKLVTGISIEENNSLPNFSFNDINGNIYTRDSLKDKIYLLAFGATWCGPCKKNIPMLQTLYNRYRSKNFEIVYINMHDDVKAWKKMIKDYKLEWINVTDIDKMANGTMANRFNIKTLPFYLVIDMSKKIIYNEHSSRDFNYMQLENRIKEGISKSSK